MDFSHVDVMSLSKNSFVKKLFEGVKENENTKTTVSMKFKVEISMNFIYYHQNQLNSLVDILRTSSAWYIRCIRPNSQKKENFVDKEMLLTQLQYSGMLETIKIRKNGFGFRYTFDQFFSKYIFFPPFFFCVNSILDIILQILNYFNQILIQLRNYQNPIQLIKIFIVWEERKFF